MKLAITSFFHRPIFLATCIGSMKKDASDTGAHAPATNMTSALLAFPPFVPRDRRDVHRLTQWSAFLVVFPRRSSFRPQRAHLPQAGASGRHRMWAAPLSPNLPPHRSNAEASVRFRSGTSKMVTAFRALTGGARTMDGGSSRTGAQEQRPVCQAHHHRNGARLRDVRAPREAAIGSDTTPPRARARSRHLPLRGRQRSMRARQSREPRTRWISTSLTPAITAPMNRD